jgi:hypothetical protein
MVEQSSHQFDIDRHLRKRKDNDQLVMVEFGHAEHPVAYQQDFKFTGDRRYIGVEGWISDPLGRRRHELDLLQEQMGQGQNIRYITQDLGIHTEDKSLRGTSDYSGIYTPETELEDGIATEIVASNLLSDPIIAFNLTRAAALLTEMSRVLERPDGIIVCRETVSPQHAIYLDDQDWLLAASGLVRVGHVTPDAPNDGWRRLEARYDGRSAGNVPEFPPSHYAFIRHSAV